MRLLVVGAGGHAKVVIDAAEAAGHTIAAVLGSTSDIREIMGHPVTTPAEAPDIAALGADGFIVAIGDNRVRAARLASSQRPGWPRPPSSTPRRSWAPTSSSARAPSSRPGSS